MKAKGSPEKNNKVVGKPDDVARAILKKSV